MSADGESNYEGLAYRAVGADCTGADTIGAASASHRFALSSHYYSAYILAVMNWIWSSNSFSGP